MIILKSRCYLFPPTFYSKKFHVWKWWQNFTVNLHLSMPKFHLHCPILLYRCFSIPLSFHPSILLSDAFQSCRHQYTSPQIPQQSHLFWSSFIVFHCESSLCCSLWTAGQTCTQSASSWLWRGMPPRHSGLLHLLSFPAVLILPGPHTFCDSSVGSLATRSCATAPIPSHVTSPFFLLRFLKCMLHTSNS